MKHFPLMQVDIVAAIKGDALAGTGDEGDALFAGQFYITAGDEHGADLGDKVLYLY